MAPAPTPPVFPDDEGAHPGVKTEWWYVFGFLSVGGTRRYSFFASLSDTPNGLDARFNVPGPSISGATFLQSGLTDLTTGQHFPARVLQVHLPRLPGHPAIHPGLTVKKLDHHFHHHGRDWHLRRLGPRQLQLHSDLDWGVLDVDLHAPETHPPLLVGGTGVVEMGPHGRSGYYSLTRLQASGTFRHHGVTEAVTGQVWHDHQWGDMSLFDGYEGWTWMGLNLEDGTDLNLFRFHQQDHRPVTVNYDLMRADGSQQHLPADPDALSALGSAWWQSPETQTWYPLAWRVDLPAEDIHLVVRSSVPNQEMPGSWPYDTGVSFVATFYEGAAHAQGTVRGQPVGGAGYLELFGAPRR